MTKPTTCQTKSKPSGTLPVPKITTKRPAVNNHDSCVCSTLRLIVVILMVFTMSAAWYINHYNTSGFMNSHLLLNDAQYTAKSFDGDLSTIFCKRYTVNAGQRADFFRINGDAKLNKQLHEIVTLSESDSINEFNYAYHSAYLLHGSAIKVKGCRIFNTLTNAEILLIKGDASWKEWKYGKCPKCVTKTVSITERALCNFQQSFDLEYNVTSNDNYYIVITQTLKTIPHSDTTYVFTRLTLNKTMYDTSGSSLWCLNQKKCTIDLDFAANQDIVFKVHRDLKFHSRLASMDTTCHKRVLFWVGIFGILPASLIILLCTCACCCYHCDKRSAKKAKKREICEALIINQPPSYEDVTKPIPGYSKTIP